MKTIGSIKQVKRLRNILFVELIIFVLVLFVYCFTLFPDFYQNKLFRNYFHPSNIAFYTDEKKQLRGFVLETLAEPIIKREALLYWAELATISVNTLASSTYEEQLNKAFKMFFTANGANSLRQAYETKGVINDIVAKNLSVTSVVQKPAILLDTGRVFGRKIWKIQVPILVTYESLNKVSVDKQLVTLIIASVPTTEHPLGLAIDQYKSTSR